MMINLVNWLSSDMLWYTLRLEAKNDLNMFDKESHNHIKIYQLRVVPSI